MCSNCCQCRFGSFKHWNYKTGQTLRGKIMKPCWDWKNFPPKKKKGNTFKGIQLDQYKTLICLFELFLSSKFWCFVLAVAITTISRHLRSVLLELMFTAGLHVLSDKVAANFDLLHSLHYRSSQNSGVFLCLISIVNVILNCVIWSMLAQII